MPLAQATDQTVATSSILVQRKKIKQSRNMSRNMSKQTMGAITTLISQLWLPHAWLNNGSCLSKIALRGSACETHYLELRFHARSLLSKRYIIPLTLTLNPDSRFKWHKHSRRSGTFGTETTLLATRFVSAKHTGRGVCNVRTIDVGAMYANST